MPRAKKSSEEIVEEVLETAKKAGASAKKATKEAAKKADTMTAEAKKMTEEAKNAVVKAARKPLKEEIYLQYAGKEVNKDEIIKQVKEIWTKQLKNKVSDISTITVYLKPEDNKAYYVINGETSGSIEL